MTRELVEQVEPVASGVLRELIVSAIRLDRDTIKISARHSASIEESISALDDIDVGPLFQDLGALYLSESTLSGAQGTEAKHRFRRLLGPRYSCLLLTSVLPGVSETSNEDAASIGLRACVEESLQWHPDAVLAEALIYYRDGEMSEHLLHECAIAPKTDAADIASFQKPMGQFLAALKEYVNKYGSSVRTKAHLKLTALPSGQMTESGNIRTLKAQLRDFPVRPLFFPFKFDLLEDVRQRGTDGQKVGDQEEFNEIVVRFLGASLGLSAGNFEVLHYSAGSDAIGATNVRATAHLYVVIKGQSKDPIALEYTIAMRETLGRLTVAFALDRMVKANDDLGVKRKEEKRRSKTFENQVQNLSRKIRDLQIDTDNVMASVRPGAWSILRDWVKVVFTLSDDNNGETFVLGSNLSVRRKHDWQAEQWAAALLRLAGASDQDFAGLSVDALHAWQRISSKALQDSEKGTDIRPMWRNLHRMGFPLGDSSEMNSDSFVSQASSCIGRDVEGHPQGDHRLRQALDKTGALYEKNGFTGLFLLFAIGAQYRDGDSGHACTWDKPMHLDDALDAECVVDGLGLLNDIVHEKKICGARSVGMRLADDEGWLSITFDQASAQVSPQTTKLFDKLMRILDQDTYPGFDNATTSMAILMALGIRADAWTDISKTLRVDRESLLLTHLDEHNDEIARCKGGKNDALEMEYRLKGRQ